MVQYVQNNSPINIEGLKNQGEQVAIIGNNNEISIGDTHCMLQVTGNGNTINVIHSSLKINILGNGNALSSIQSRLKLKIMGNANSFKSQMEVQPMKVFKCQGFGNQFPENVIDRSVNVGVNNNIGRIMPIIQNNNQYKVSSPQQQSKQPASKVSYNNSNPNSPISKPTNFRNSLNTVNSMIQQYADLGQMVDEKEEEQEEYRRFLKGQRQRVAAQKAANLQREMIIQQRQRQQKRMQEQARIVQQQALRVQRGQMIINQQHPRPEDVDRRQHSQQSYVGRMQEEYFAVERMVPQQPRRGNREVRPNSNGENDFPSVNIFYNNSNANRERSQQYPQLPRVPVRRVQQQQKKLPDHGLTPAEMERLHTHYHTGPEQECTICFLEIATNDQATFLQCFHGYHAYCIQSWLKKSSKCPICNENVRKNF